MATFLPPSIAASFNLKQPPSPSLNLASLYGYSPSLAFRPCFSVPLASALVNEDGGPGRCSSAQTRRRHRRRSPSSSSPATSRCSPSSSPQSGHIPSTLFGHGGFSLLQRHDNAISEGNFASKLSLSDEESSCIGGMDFITLIFTLSAAPSERMPLAIKECFSVLKHGGILFFRDYGLYDMNMLRFQPEKRVGLREYVRNDGTLSYFFSLDVIRDLFLGAGFIELELDYCCIKSVNRRKEKCMNMVWVHGKFQKPL